jgi:hypothetical protein
VEIYIIRKKNRVHGPGHENYRFKMQRLDHMQIDALKINIQLMICQWWAWLLQSVRQYFESATKKSKALAYATNES